ncbi:MAG: HEAT repeat domain-containing protein [Spirochaetes bacterium]|nr:HEAT repeat domain-containing protein [Spirochaetota bacterium]
MKKVCIAIIVMFAMVAVFQPQEAKSEQSKSSKEYIADLSSKDEGTIVRAADWLGKEKEEEALPRLKNLLQYDIRPNVRLHSAMAMGYIG